MALQRGRIGRDVATLVDAPTARHEEIEPLTNSEARRLLEAARGLPNGARWSVALALGLRQGEALGFLWDAIDQDAGTLTVRWALQRQVGKGVVLVPPKSKAGRRTIKLPDQLRDTLRTHRVRQHEQRLAAANVWEDGSFVFCQSNGRPLDARRDWQAWKVLLKSAGVRDARLHDARHTAATMLLQQGVPARVAMQILGHSQISLTLGALARGPRAGAGGGRPDRDRSVELTERRWHTLRHTAECGDIDANLQVRGVVRDGIEPPTLRFSVACSTS